MRKPKHYDKLDAEKVRNIIKQNGWVSYSDFFRHIGMTDEYIRQCERNGGGARKSTITKIARMLNVREEDLIKENDEKEEQIEEKKEETKSVLLNEKCVKFAEFYSKIENISFLESVDKILKIGIDTLKKEIIDYLK